MSTHSGPNIVEDGLVLSLDPANQKSYSVNQFPYSRDIFSWTQSAGVNNGTQSRDTSMVSPVGNSPVKLVVSGNDSHFGTYNSGAWNFASAKNGETWTVSVYVKATIATTCQIFIFGANSAGTGFIGGSWLAITAQTHNVTTEWTRVSTNITMANPDIANIQFRLDGPDSYVSPVTLWFDGVQVEKSSSATTFNPNYYGTSIKDISNNLNNGTVSTNLLFNSLNNGSLQYLSASSTNISFSNSSSLQFLNVSPYTLEAWVYPTVNPGTNNWSGIFDRESNPGSGRDGYNLYFLGSAGSNTYFTSERFCSGVNTQVSVTLDQSLSINNWQHLVVTYDGATMTLYRNGTSVSTNTSTGNITNTSKALTIGLRGGQYFTGRIGATNIYNVALTNFQVLQNFNALRGRYGL